MAHGSELFDFPEIPDDTTTRFAENVVEMLTFVPCQLAPKNFRSTCHERATQGKFLAQIAPAAEVLAQSRTSKLHRSPRAKSGQDELQLLSN